MKRRLFVIAVALAFCAGCRGATGPVGTVPDASQIVPQTATGPQIGSPASPNYNINELPEPPAIHAVHGVATLDLIADINPATGLPGFEYEGVHGVAPTIYVKPGQTFVVNISDEMLASGGLAADINLHFHGLGSSPKAPGDDVLGMLAKPGQRLHYVVHVPRSQEPGLYWYHPHVHGETSYQVGEGGMSGALVIEGLEKHFPAIAKMRERVIVVRSTGIGINVQPTGSDDDDDVDATPAQGSGDGMSGMPAAHVHADNSNTQPCVTADHLTTTLNGAYHPVITIAPGEKQFFRVVNATGHKTLNLSVDGEQLELVAIDGFALDTYHGTGPTEMLNSIIIPPAARAEFIVTGPKSGRARFRSLCYNSGPNGDPDPPRLLATIERPAHKSLGGYFGPEPLTVGAPLPRNVYTMALPAPTTKRLVIFSENNNPSPGFYINGKQFSVKAPPMFVVHTGTVEEWRIVNVTQEIHDFHIHQLHFLVERINGVKLKHPFWADSEIVPHRYRVGNKSVPGSITALMNFLDPIIRGEFVFHCHILDHEDAGMMAKIEAI